MRWSSPSGGDDNEYAELTGQVSRAEGIGGRENAARELRDRRKVLRRQRRELEDAQDHLSDPEEGRIDTALQKNEPFDAVVFGHIQVGQVLYGGEIENPGNKNAQQVFQLVSSMYCLVTASYPPKRMHWLRWAS